MTPARDALLRELERAADRLRVLGPRWEARGQAPPEAPRRVLQQLADLAADLEGGRRRAVPDLGGRVLADQILVLGHDLAGLADERAASSAREWLEALRRSL